MTNFNFISHFFVSGWNLRGLQCYQFFNIRHSWQKASELCKRYVYHYQAKNISLLRFLFLQKKSYYNFRILWPRHFHANHVH
jgi:hypothetical protein